MRIVCWYSVQQDQCIYIIHWEDIRYIIQYVKIESSVVTYYPGKQFVAIYGHVREVYQSYWVTGFRLTYRNTSFGNEMPNPV